MSPDIRHELLIVCAQFHGESSPQLHSEYTIGRPVFFSACDITSYRLYDSI